MSRKRQRLRNTIIRPNDVNGLATIRTDFYRGQLRRIVKGLFELRCPDFWDKDYILNKLCFERGFFTIFDTEVFGITALECGITGFNIYNSPTTVQIQNPLLAPQDHVIGIDCTLVYLDKYTPTSFYTFNQLIDIYAEQLATCDASIDVNLITSRTGYFIEAETKAQAETIKATVDKITEGEPLVVARTDSIGSKGANVFFNNLKQNYITDLLQDAKRSIINEFLTAIGINNANTDKKERLITGEVNANNSEIQINTEVFKWHLQQATDQTNFMFPELDFYIGLKEYGNSTVEQVESEEIKT